MIYLDSAATSMIKPRAVREAVVKAMTTMSSPGRGGHAPAMRAADAAYDCRCAVSDLFRVGSPEKVVFTFNATHGLNIAIHSLIGKDDKVVISGYEHNSVTRPLRLLGADVKVARSPLFDQAAAIEAFRRELPGAKAAVCTHVSNVFGYILPVEEISKMCAGYGVPFILDASQSAGGMDIDFNALGAAFMAMPGHKGLLGPQGTGVLICRDGAKPLLAGGTGSESANPLMPEYLPDRLEAGTHNVAGIAGLREGIRYIAKRGAENIRAHERLTAERLASMLRAMEGMEIFDSGDPRLQVGVLSVRFTGYNSETLASALGERGVAVRGGLHCSPEGHISAGTFDTGTVRFSVSPFTAQEEAVRAAKITAECLKSLKADEIRMRP